MITIPVLKKQKASISIRVIKLADKKEAGASLGVVLPDFPLKGKSIGQVDKSFGFYSGIKGKKQSFGKQGHWTDYGLAWQEGDLLRVDLD